MSTSSGARLRVSVVVVLSWFATSCGGRATDSSGPPGPSAHCNPGHAPQLLAVTVRNPATDTLQDYPIAIPLERAQFDFSRALSDGSDIAAWNADFSQPLAHWVESYDAASQRGLVWIKLGTIAPQESRTLWLTSGSVQNCQAQPNDGHEVFPFFSDVQNLHDWNMEGQIALTDKVTSGPIEITDRRTIESDGSYNSTPGLVEAANGDWVLAYRKGAGHVNVPLVILRRSQDQGATWTPEAVYFDTSGNDPSLARTPAGDLLIAFVKKDASGVAGGAYSRSMDNGLSWGDFTFFGSPVSDTSAIPTRFLNAGTSMFAASYGPSRVDANFAPFLWTSTDDGLTWTKRSSIRLPGEPGMNETAIELLDPGSLLSISRADDNQNTYGHFSRDLGETWEPVVTYTSQIGVLQLPQLLKVGSSLLLLGRENYFFTTQLVAYVSYDGGQTFRYGTVLDHWLNNPIDGGYCWPLLLPDGRVFVVYYADPQGIRKPDIESLVLQLGSAQDSPTSSVHIASGFDLARATQPLNTPPSRYSLEVRFRSHDTPGGNQFAVQIEDGSVQPPLTLVRWESPSESAVPNGNSGFFAAGQFMPIGGNFVFDQPTRLRTTVDEAAGQQQVEILDQFGSVLASSPLEPLATGTSGHATTVVIGNNTPRRTTDTLLDFVFLRPRAGVEPVVSVARVH